MTGRSRSDKRTYRHTSRKNHSQWIHQLCLAASKQARTCFCRREKVADIIFSLSSPFTASLCHLVTQLTSAASFSSSFRRFFLLLLCPGHFFPALPFISPLSLFLHDAQSFLSSFFSCIHIFQIDDLFSVCFLGRVIFYSILKAKVDMI